MRDLYKVRLFDNLSCFIDGLCAINDRLKFVKNHKDIYPAEVELEKKNISTSEASLWIFQL